MRRKLRIAALGLVIFSFVTSDTGWSRVYHEQPNSILTYYVKQAAATFTSRDPLKAGVNFSFRATTYYNDLARGGKEHRSDSSVIDYYYSFGALDSSINIARPAHKHPTVDIAVPNVFSMNYIFNFFPNDTGGSNLPIGFDTPDTANSNPTGIAIIDRDRFFLKRLYLYYPNSIGFKRYSRAFRFVEYQGFIFPDSISEVRAEAGIFSSKHYRVETGIGQLKIYR